MADLGGLSVAELEAEELKRLEEAERLINSAGRNHKIYLMALWQKED